MTSQAELWFGAALLVLLAISGFAVVRTRDVTAQVVTLSFYGLVMALIFIVFQAPDVALSQVTVGAVALPMMIMLAISRMKFLKIKTAEKGCDAQ